MTGIDSVQGLGRFTYQTATLDYFQAMDTRILRGRPLLRATAGTAPGWWRQWGLYAVIGYDVTQRAHELGVRIALGAQSRDLIRFVVGQGVRFAVAGIVVGSSLAWLGSRWIEPLLFQQSATDPIVFGAVALCWSSWPSWPVRSRPAAPPEPIRIGPCERTEGAAGTGNGPETPLVTVPQRLSPSTPR